MFRDYDYPAEIAAGRLALRMKPGAATVGKLAKGRRILLRSGERIEEAKVVATTPVAATPGELARPPLRRLRARPRDADCAA